MTLTHYIKKIASLAHTIRNWLDALADMDPARKERLARYAEKIAETLHRASDALNRSAADPDNVNARRHAIRELGRIKGYVESLVRIPEGHIDGRKLSGIRRRLETIDSIEPSQGRASHHIANQLDQLADAEGYVRALADGLRA